MAITAPRALLIIDYNTFFGVEPPIDRISLIKGISKEHILYEISALNYRLKPKNKIQIDDSFSTQVNELKYFTKTKELFMKYSNVASKYTKNRNEYPIIFNRQCCLFAIEEIVNSNDINTIDDFDMAKIEIWESILKYLLAVNYAIIQIKIESDDVNATIELLNHKLLPLNELVVETDPIFTPFRGYWLIDYFLNKPLYSNLVKKYFQETYGIEPQCFIFHLMSMFLSNDNNKPEYNFFYSVNEGQQEIFDILSKRIPNKEIHKLISIRKSPFINVGKLKYLISDNTLLIEKAYSQFINDFWFDSLKLIKDTKGKEMFNISGYRSEFGYFFEKYLANILRKCFENYKYSTLLLFDQLKVNTIKGDVEIADVYLRYGNKILLGQVKSGSIYDAAKFGDKIELLYNKDRNAFFDNFGVNQIVKSLNNMHKYMQTIDQKFPKGHSYEVYPCIFVNDKVFQTPLMPDVFNTRFQELIKVFNINKVIIKPLTLIHINDIERLEDPLNRCPTQIWELLKFNHMDKKIIPPFYNTINQKHHRREYPARIMNLFKSLILKYNPDIIID